MTIKTSQEPLPNGSVVDPQTGNLTQWWKNFFEGGRRQNGEIISGVNANTQTLIDLNTSVGDNAAAILSEASVRADADTAIAGTVTSLTATVGDNTASVSAASAAIADIEGNISAAYGVTVDVDGRVAALKLLSDGTTATASILGDLIYFGPQTVFDTATETFITEVGSIRSRYGTAFGASSDLIRWDGPVAVEQGDETPTNGYLSIKTDGTIYHNSAALSWGATAAEAAASNAQVPLGTNLLINSDWESSIDGWGDYYTNAAGTYTYGMDFAGLSGSPIRTAYFHVTGTPAADTLANVIGSKAYSSVADLKRWAVRCEAGERFWYGAYMSSHRCYAQVRAYFFNAAGTYVGEALTEGAYNDYGSGFGFANGDPANAVRIGGFATAPTGARYVILTMTGRMGGTEAEPYCFAGWPMLARVSSTQTVAPKYNSGPPDRYADVTGDNQAADVAPGAVSDTAADSTDAAVALSNNTWTNVASATVAVASGADVIINGFCFHVANYSGGAAGSAAVTAQVRLRRDSTVLRTQDATTYVYLTGGPGSLTSASRGPTTISDVDLSLSAGTYTYTLQANINLNSVGASSTTRDISNRLLWVTQLKR